MKDREGLPAHVCLPVAPRAICLLLSEHPKMVCIFADFPASCGRGSSSHWEPGFFPPHLSQRSPLHTCAAQMEQLMIYRSQQFCTIHFLLPHFINISAKFPFISYYGLSVVNNNIFQILLKMLLKEVCHCCRKACIPDRSAGCFCGL